MLKKHQEQVKLLVRVGDIVISALAFGLAYWLRTSDQFFEPSEKIAIEPLAWLLATSIVLHFFTYPYFGFYESLRRKNLREIISKILQAGIVEFFVLAALVFLIQAKETSRYFFSFYVFLNYSVLLVQRLGARILLSSIRKRGYNYRQVLVVGMTDNAKRLIDTLKINKHWGYVVFGVLRGPGQELTAGSGIPEHSTLHDIPIIGNYSELEQIVRDRTVDEVYYALDQFSTSDIADQVQLCEKLGIPARFSLSLFDLPQSQIHFMNLDRVPVISFYNTTVMTPVEAFLKRAIDIVVALIGLFLTAWVYLWITRRIRKESPGPVIFKQVRVGENGRLFKCYKFRTMYLDAEARKAELLKQNQMQGPIFKIDNDPRIFPFGNFLRRTSLDELPQFLNILRGDMSVVGTRPPTPDEVSRYEMRFRRRLSIRPGLTGLWQVSGRNQIRDFEDILALDLKYIDNWSLWLDTKIIFKTMWVAVFGKGAT